MSDLRDWIVAADAFLPELRTGVEDYRFEHVRSWRPRTRGVPKSKTQAKRLAAKKAARKARRNRK